MHSGQAQGNQTDTPRLVSRFQSPELVQGLGLASPGQPCGHSHMVEKVAGGIL